MTDVSWPSVGDLLSSDDGDSLVVADDTNKADALVMLVAEVYGGDDLDPTNPVLVAALPDVSCEVWRRYSDAAAEADGIDLEGYGSWFGPGGDGESIGTVVSYEGSVYSLGEEAVAAAEADADEGHDEGMP